MKLGLVEIRYRPVIHTGVRPGKKIVTTARRGRGAPFFAPFCRRDEHINWMFVSLINQSGYSFAIKIIEAAADKRESRRGSEIVNLGREIDFAVERGFDGVLVGRCDVEEGGVRHQ